MVVIRIRRDMQPLMVCMLQLDTIIEHRIIISLLIIENLEHTAFSVNHSRS